MKLNRPPCSALANAAVALAEDDALTNCPDALVVHAITVAQVLRADGTVTLILNHSADVPEDVAITVAEALVTRYAATGARS